MLIMELLEWLGVIVIPETCTGRGALGPFFYGEKSGPESWRCAYPDSRGKNQSPVNIICQTAVEMTPCKSLSWHGYADEPLSMNIINDGNTVILCGYWTRGSRPYIKGGPLQASYEFHSVQFRWGPDNDEGSEHTLNYVRYPFELQAVHTKRDTESLQVNSNCRHKSKDEVAIISYLFEVTSTDNPYLDHVITNLWHIPRPGSRIQVPAFPLEWLFPKFDFNYYTYNGSLTAPPCSEVVTWIVTPETLAISASQLAEFRKINSIEGPILSNSRPVQKMNDREIFYYT